MQVKTQESFANSTVLINDASSLGQDRQASKVKEGARVARPHLGLENSRKGPKLPMRATEEGTNRIGKALKEGGDSYQLL